MRILKIPKVRTVLDLGILIMCLKSAFTLSAIVPYTEAVDTFLAALSTACFVIAILHEYYSIETLFLYGVISLISLYSVFQTGDYGFLITIITCFAIRGKELKKILSFIFQFQLIFFCIHTIAALLLALLGVVPIVRNISGIERYTFGFGHPNTFSVFLFNLLILWTWLNFEKVEIRHIVAIFFIAVVALYFTKTRTSFVTTVIFCVLLLVSRSDRKFKKLLKPTAEFIVPICSGLTLLCVNLLLSGNLIAEAVNALLSDRIKLGAYGVSHYGYSFLGQKVAKTNIVWEAEWGFNGFTFDNIYTYLAVNQGIIWILLLSVLFYYLAKKEDLKTSIFIIIWALYGITEVHGLNGFISFPILLVVSLFEHRVFEIKWRRGKRE